MEQPVNSKTKWYRAHKDEPGFLDILNQTRKRYYNRNIEEERKKARERYYRRRDAPLVELSKEILNSE
jgi:hypothetical protein